MTTPSLEEVLDSKLATLTLTDKVRLVTGRDFWTTWPVASVGLRSMVLSDGPSGVRGELWDERSPSLNFPSTTTLASSWDDTVAERYGRACAAEARRKGVDVILGPTVNLHRSPLGGRNFECFSEDPVLTARLAAAYVRGAQASGVAATPKHYVANDFETERFHVDVRVSDRALRELYLRAFEEAIATEGAWAVMSAYNSVNGSTMTENSLLEVPLRTEWDFDGVVISDWSAVRTLNSAHFPQDLVMPGPDGPWGDRLEAAVVAGEIAAEVLDAKVRNIMRLAARVGALEGCPPHSDGPDPAAEDGIAFARDAAAEGTVMLANNGVLPLGEIATIAVLGHNARDTRTQGGGSATVVPDHVVSALDGIRATFPHADVSYRLGAVVQEELSALEPALMRDPVSGQRGARVTFRGADGGPLLTETRLASNLAVFNGTVALEEVVSIQFECLYTAPETQTVRLGFAGVGFGRLFLDDELFIEDTLISAGRDLGAAFLAPPAATRIYDFTAGVTHRLRLELVLVRDDTAIAGAVSFRVGTEPAEVAVTELIAEAASIAAAADVAVVVVGTNSRVESEGHDRATLQLPGSQDDLVRAVAAANPRTVVVINAGAPILMPWRHEVAAILVSYFGGQEFGQALGDVLSGSTEPGGRLPTTWPDTEAAVPILETVPTNGLVVYEEGLHVGYKAWLQADAEPAFPFGHGLGYTSWQLADPAVHPAAGGDVELTAAITNTGAREGKQVVQVYCEKPGSKVDRPVRWLVGFRTVRLGPGAATRLRIQIPRRELAYWDNGWVVEPGGYTFLVGWSVTNLRWAGVVSS